MVLVLYFPDLNLAIGSSWGTMLLTRSCYWYRIKKGNSFYKFFNPCGHDLYKVGDSWSEELGCSKNVLAATFKDCGTRIKRGQSYNLIESGWLLFYSIGNGMTRFLPNYPKMLTLDMPDEILKKYFLHFRNWKIKNPNPEKWNRKIRISDFRNSNFGLPYIQEDTQVTTHIITQEEVSCNVKKELINNSKSEKEKGSAQKEKVIMPFETMAFVKVWDAWKDYRTQKLNKIYSEKAEMAALFPLGNYSEEFSINLITKAISNQWKDFHYVDTPLKFKKFSHDKSSTTGQEFEPHVAALLQ